MVDTPRQVRDSKIPTVMWSTPFLDANVAYSRISSIQRSYVGWSLIFATIINDYDLLYALQFEIIWHGSNEQFVSIMCWNN